MTQEVLLKRAECKYQADNSRFLLECDFSKQYSHYYRKRLEKTKPFLEFNCRSKWGDIPIYKLAELAALSCCDIDNQEQLLSPTPSLADVSAKSSATQSSFEFSKRMRKLSESSKTSPVFKSSTQKDERISKTPTTSGLQSPLESPIFAPQQENISNDDQKQECIVLGTIFKRMKLQPDVIRELSKGDFHVKCERYLGHYTSQDDSLVLEDTTESISLIGNIKPEEFVTGVVVGLLGIAVGDGSQFLVRDICYAEPIRQLYDDDAISSQGSSLERPLQSLDSEPMYLMVVSCLGFRHDLKKSNQQTQALQNMIDFIWGGGKYAEDERSSRVCRILVVGDSLLEDRLSSKDEFDQTEDIMTKMKQTRQVKQYDNSVQAVKHMDDFFAQLSKTINVDVMPGPSDPSTHLMPQQPFHPCMFPKSCMFPTFNCVTNPHRAIYDDKVEVLATSGQNVDIIGKFSGITDPIEIMKHHLMWGNSAPSAPDNLYSVPYEDEDPHIIDFIPEIYIAGCQDSFKTDYHYYNLGEPSDKTRTAKDLSNPKDEAEALFTIPKIIDQNSKKPTESTIKSPQASFKKDRTLLITVPNFSDTYQCILINLKNLKPEMISFKVQSIGS